MKFKDQNVDELKEWGVHLVRAIKKVCKGKSEQTLFNSVIEYFENSILDANKEKVLKNLIREIELWALNLNPDDLEKVNKIMFKKFGKYIGEENVFKKVGTIIKRGVIKNSNEYRLLNEILNLYSDDSSKRILMDSVSQLIFSFEKDYKGKK